MKSTFLVLGLSFIAAQVAGASPLPDSAPNSRDEPVSFSVPLKKRALAPSSPELFLAGVDRMRNRYGHYEHIAQKDRTPELTYAKLIQSKSKRQNNPTQGDATLINYDSLLYASDVYIGTPPQHFSLNLDTGSADLVIETAPCQTSACGQDSPLYDPSKSTSARSTREPFSIAYVDSSQATGTVLLDTVSMAGFTLENVGIGAVSSTTRGFSYSNTSGILGLGFYPKAASQRTPFLQRLAWGNSTNRNSVLAEPLFGFSMILPYDVTRVDRKEDIIYGGVVTVGYIDRTLYQGDINWVNINTSYGDWGIPLDDVTVDGKSVGLSARHISIDTGSTVMGFSRAACDAIYAALPGGGPYPREDGIYQYDCSHEADVAFTLGGISYKIPNAFFNRGPLDTRGTKCFGAITFADTGDDDHWIIGDAFIASLYTIFRFGPLSSSGNAQPSIGFAQPTRNLVVSADDVRGGSSGSGSGSGSSSGGPASTGSSGAGASSGLTPLTTWGILSSTVALYYLL